MHYELTDNEAAKQYEFHVDGKTPRIEYIKTKDKIFLTHTEVPTSLEGKGIAPAPKRQAPHSLWEYNMPDLLASPHEMN